VKSIMNVFIYSTRFPSHLFSSHLLFSRLRPEKQTAQGYQTTPYPNPNPLAKNADACKRTKHQSTVARNKNAIQSSPSVIHEVK
jgi:hypothetical protein